MKINQTKALETVLAKGLFETEQAKTGNPADHAFAALLDGDDSHAVHILGRFLKGWELYQIKAKIEREIEEAAKKNRKKENGAKALDALYEALEPIAKECAHGEDVVLNTAHLLLHMVREKKYVSSRALAMYSLDERKIKECVCELPMQEDYYAEMNALRNVRILRINPQPQQDAPEEDGEDAYGQEDENPKSKKGVAGLEKYGVDLTKQVLAGNIDPVIGRDKEIERLVQILGRRKKNNPVLIGEAGVGKSAIVEGLAAKLVQRDVPPALYGKRVFSLDVASMVAGTKYRGQFEERIKGFIKELKKNKDVILFIDEIHTIVGAGSTQGSLDTANILKPMLARGEIQCIGATTLDEYRENIEKDGALERRFQKIIVEPTSKDDTLKILTNIREHYELHHGVRYSDEALAACVDLTDRYVTDRHFPDKAIDALDEAGSKARIFGAKEPEVIRQLETALQDMRKEKYRATAACDHESTAKARMKEIAIDNKLKEVRADWQREQKLNPTIVGAENIRDVVSSMTGIPLRDVTQNERSRLKDMYSNLESVVVGQPEALLKVTKSIRRARAGLKDPDKPMGVFMFVGPTGVGKTLLAKELSNWMFGRGDALIRIDMSEYSEKHNVSRLVGSPPGYVGYNEGGQLTEIVRRQPYAVILFDEIEKAHPDVFNIMLQIFDDGQLTDGTGRKVDFRNTIIIMTSNVGSHKAAAAPPVIGFGAEEVAGIEEANAQSTYKESLERVFAPEFLNRIDDIVVFNTLSGEDIKRVVDIELGKFFRRTETMGFSVDITDEARERLAEEGYEPRYGVRSLKRFLLEKVEEPLSEMIVCEDVAPGQHIEIGLDGEEITLVRCEVKCPASA